LWTARVEAMEETGEKRLWKATCYMDGEFMTIHAQELTYKEAIEIAKELEENFDNY